MKTDQKRLLSLARAGDISSLAKLLTWAENASAGEVYGLDQILEPPHVAFRLGITGPPGAGKSTLVSGLIGHLRSLNLRVAVLAVDPSSPFTGGAILGDRIRYQDHFLDEQVFIRSLGTRGSLGGLSASAHRILRIFDLCNFDVVLVETVGVGQTELDILHVADRVAVVLVPESGDSIQAMKAGLMEVADFFIVNKADRPGASAMAKDIESSFVGELDGKTPPKVFMTTASKGEGLDLFVNEIRKFLEPSSFQSSFQSERNRIEKIQHEMKMMLRQKAEMEIAQKVSALRDLKDFVKTI